MRDKLIKFVINIVLPNNENEIVSSQKKLKTIRGWDSLSLLSLITEVQKEYGIKISIEEAISLDTIEDVVQIISNKTS